MGWSPPPRVGVSLTYLFRTPVIELKPARGGKLLSRYRFPNALSVVKYGSTYEVLNSPSQDIFDAADHVYQGGREHFIDDAEAALLTAAGYGDYLTEVE